MDVEARENVNAQDSISSNRNLILRLCSPLFPQAIPCFQFKGMFFRHIEALQGFTGLPRTDTRSQPLAFQAKKVERGIKLRNEKKKIQINLLLKLE